MANKYCLECGIKLVGAQLKFCSPKHRLDYYRRNNKVRLNSYFKDYMSKYRSINKGNRYCKYCGIKLPKFKQKFCSKTHREQYYKESDLIHSKVLKEAKLTIDYPLYCDECGAKIIIDGNDIVCSKCGLVFN